MENLNKYSISHTIIDMGGYYGGNYLLNKFAETSKPKIRDTIVFGIADLLIRNYPDKFNSFSSKLPGDDKTRKDSLIALLSFVANSAWDISEGKSMTKALMNNAIKNGIGFATNMIVDKVIPSEYV